MVPKVLKNSNLVPWDIFFSALISDFFFSSECLLSHSLKLLQYPIFLLFFFKSKSEYLVAIYYLFISTFIANCKVFFQPQNSLVSPFFFYLNYPEFFFPQNIIMFDAIKVSNTSEIQVTKTLSIVLVGDLQNTQPSLVSFLLSTLSFDLQYL